ncbi:MAG: glutathione S-transferase family protein [Cellvibrionaceae bacterium]
MTVSNNNATHHSHKLEPFQVHLADISYYSGKLEMYLRYKNIAYERVEMSLTSGVSQVYANTGVRKVPAMQSANGQWFRESTNMIDWLEQQYPQPRVIPRDPAMSFLNKLIEDYADEWCWRSAMYWRWKSDDNASFMGRRLGQEVCSELPLPTSLTGYLFKRRQRRLFLSGDGVDKNTETLVRNQYYSLCESFSDILSEQRFLLGDQPSLVDFAFMGPFFRHYFCDPIPAKIMRDRYPKVLAWVTRMWNEKAQPYVETNLPLSNFDNIGWSFIWREILNDYLPYLHQNSDSWYDGKKRFDYKTQGVTFKNLPVVHHRVYCLEVLQDQFNALNHSEQQQVHSLLQAYGSLNLGPAVQSGLKPSYQLPLKPRSSIGLFEKVEVFLTGSPWDMNRPPKQH